MDTHRPRLGEILIERGKLAPRDLEHALAAQREIGGLLGRVLIQLGLVAEADVLSALANQLGIPHLQAEELPDELIAIEGLSTDFVLAQSLLPLRVHDGALVVAMSNPQDAYLLKALGLAAGLRIEPQLAADQLIQDSLQRLLGNTGAAADDADDVAQDSTAFANESAFLERLRDLASGAPIINLVSQIISRVIELRASDIHLEAFEDGLHVRYRVDGVLEAGSPIDAQRAPAVVSRVKLLANMDIAERRLPQDGRIRSRVKGHELDLRVSTLPTVHGESVVLRVLDRAGTPLNLEEMSFAPATLQAYQALAHRPHGIVLLTGPTGSGKTTTLYATLSRLDTRRLKVVTVEDPIEYQLDGISQVQVKNQIGLSFSQVLRATLRQDPDVIMIGEMRDSETARIAVQAALTGHLVFSTLHTNTAPGAVVRLVDMGIERYLINSTVVGVLSQRLVRRLCEHCRTRVAADDAIHAENGLARFMAAGQTHILGPAGCTACRGTGYSGRTAVHELLTLTTPIRQAILAGVDESSLLALAREEGMLTLHEDGLRKVASGITSLEEVLRASRDTEDA